MRIFTYIKTILAVFLLMIFAVSITPKRFLHNVFAKHIDNSKQTDDNNQLQFKLSGYNCDTDNLVAESAFDYDPAGFQFTVFSFYPSFILRNISFTSVHVIYSLLRGPPVNV